MSQASIPVVDLRRGYLAYRDEFNAAVQRVLESGWYILGREVEAFEEGFARWCGVGHAISVANGTDAIIVALRALGIGPGDAVFTVSHTAVATVAAIELVGATPVLIDIEPNMYTISPEALERAILQYANGSTAGMPKAVIAVHLYGQACDLPALLDICKRHNLRLIEDCAQAHGARFKGQRVGTFGDIATFSFYPTKNLGAFGDGGAIVTNDAALAERCGAIRQYGWFTHYQSDIPGQNSRLDEMQAALLSVKLPHLDEEVAARRAIAAIYDSGLPPHIVPPPVRANTAHAYHLYVIRAQDRDALAATLKAQGIATGIHYPVPVHRQKAYAGRVPVGAGGLPNTEALYPQILSLPMNPFLSIDEVHRVVARVAAAVA